MYSFVGSGGESLYVAKNGQKYPSLTKIIAPENAEYLVVNFNANYKYSLFKGELTTNRISDVDTLLRDIVACGDIILIDNKLFDGNFNNIYNWLISVGTASFENNICEFTLTSTTSSTCGISCGFNVATGHKYYISVQFKADYTPQTFLIGMNTSNENVINKFTNVGDYNRMSTIVTATDGDTIFRARFYPKGDNGFSIGDTVYFKEAVVIDLTEAFGVDNEPKILDFENALHRYNEGRMIITMKNEKCATPSSYNNDMITKITNPRKITIPTYEGSGQNVHPSIVSFISAWNGYKYWMGITPYPNTNDAYENPSILASNDGETWVVPSGLSNPIFPGPTQNPINGIHVHNSDPCLVYYNNKLYCYFNTWNTTTGATRLYRLDSSDGVTWGNGVECTFEASGRETEPSWTLLSPSIIRLSNNWLLMWGQYKNMYRATSVDGISWSSPEKIAFDLPINIDMWHCSFSYERNGFVCVLSAHKDNTTQNSNALYIGRSLDGYTFYFDPNPILEPFGDDYANKQIYKSCLARIEDTYRIYFSCQNTSYQWSVGVFDILFNNVNLSANVINVILATSSDSFVIGAGSTKTFGALAPIGAKAAIAVRTKTSASLEVRALHATKAGITACSEVIMTMNSESTKSCVFDTKSEIFYIAIKNVGQESVTLHTVLLTLFA